ncbi:MAG: helix-hairpin-helix domain-containing protein [Chitinophagaceae bacterium]|nr:MAG: helix-hairpin-helix domain-containing protein [Chitinophagaceae bacterium]
MKKRQLIGEYFQFTRKDRVATIIIALILLTAFFLPEIVEKRFASKAPVNDTSWISALQRLEKPKSALAEDSRVRDSKDDYKYGNDQVADKYNNDTRQQLFNFDPNTISAEGWRKLGVREKTIGTIQKYLAKGGHFRKQEDLLKVYGLPATKYEQLKPYIDIAPHAPPPPAYPRQDEKSPGPFPKRIPTVDINTGDSAAFEALPGIGAKLAVRIIRFREKLGGFHSLAQVSETFGLEDTTFQKIKPFLLLQDGEHLRKIDLNTATLNEFGNHPYIRYKLAQVIIQYRNQHGLFTSADDLKKIEPIDKITFEKIRPYLMVPEKSIAPL